MTTTRTHAPSTQAIRPATAADVDTTSAVLAAAFRDDPVFGWCFPDPERRSTVLADFFQLAASTVEPHQDSDVIDDGRAAALWIPAGSPVVPHTSAVDFETAVAELVGADSERTFALMAMLDEHHPTAEHCYLWFLGVHPSHQRTGLGSALLASKLARCDADGSSAYLDATSPDNRRLYERHGFEVVAERSVHGSPPMWAMWRDPR